MNSVSARIPERYPACELAGRQERYPACELAATNVSKCSAWITNLEEG